MSKEWSLHERLQADTSNVTDLALCRCLLMEDARFPWLILVPRMANLRELHDLPKPDRGRLFDEIDAASTALQSLTQAHKLNVAALGNQVAQLHIHVIARQQNDAAWPGPVWGVGSAEPYTDNVRDELLNALRSRLNA